MTRENPAPTPIGKPQMKKAEPMAFRASGRSTRGKKFPSYDRLSLAALRLLEKIERAERRIEKAAERAAKEKSK